MQTSQILLSVATICGKIVRRESGSTVQVLMGIKTSILKTLSERFSLRACSCRVSGVSCRTDIRLVSFGSVGLTYFKNQSTTFAQGHRNANILPSLNSGESFRATLSVM